MYASTWSVSLYYNVCINFTAVYSDCEVELCKNGGKCRKLGPSYICECGNGYTGIDCEIG